jgi:hypothetical protein
MDTKKIAEIITVASQCKASLETLHLELLGQLVVNTNEIVSILRASQPNVKAVVEPVIKAPVIKAPVVEPVVEPVIKAPVAKKKAVAAPKEAEVKAVSKEDVLTVLVNFIGEYAGGEEAGEEALAKILQELGGYNQFPEVPAEKYAELLDMINQG